MFNEETFVTLDRDLLEQCLKELGSILKKKLKVNSFSCELTIVGGASVVLNYGFRPTTMDIDCMDDNQILMNDAINKIAEKHHLPSTWINTNFMYSNSYTPNLCRYAEYYKTYGNGALIVRTIKDEYLLAMKVVSGRKYKNDYSDIYGIITSMNGGAKKITSQRLKEAIVDLYGSLEKANPEALKFAMKLLENSEIISFEELRKMEAENAQIVKEAIEDKREKADIDSILSTLETI